MPIDHARKNQLNAIKDAYGVKHADAIALLDPPTSTNAMCFWTSSRPTAASAPTPTRWPTWNSSATTRATR
ncbi:hypothetical protein GCM10022402_43310 [Salinactinospora qingdaonensis]|uniref:Uncharacterized protein n=1 Tax=Salinactinospora qingdaonensis TaxID=702744 RepID=A0ABP7GDE1_9ACTN